REAIGKILKHPGVLDATGFVGFDGPTFTNAPNTGAIFFTLKSFEDRARRGLPAARIVADLRRELSRFKDAFVIVLEPASVPGIGTGGGLKGYVQNRTGQSLAELERGTWLMAGAASQTPGFTQAFRLFNTRTPQIYADVDRTKSELLGVPINRVFEALSVYMGSIFVNDFNILGRTYRVTAQADNAYRLNLQDIANLKARNASGEMVPIGATATFD